MGKGRKHKQSKEELTLLFIQLVNKGEHCQKSSTNTQYHKLTLCMSSLSSP